MTKTTHHMPDARLRPSVPPTDGTGESSDTGDGRRRGGFSLLTRKHRYLGRHRRVD